MSMFLSLTELIVADGFEEELVHDHVRISYKSRQRSLAELLPSLSALMNDGMIADRIICTKIHVQAL